MQHHHKILAGICAAIVILALIAFVFTHPRIPRAFAPSADSITATSTSNDSDTDDTIVPISKPVENTKPPVQSIAVGEPYPITVQGTQACLPFKDTTGVHPAICALGIKSLDGKYYGLHDTDPSYTNLSQFSGEGTFEIKGVMHPKTDATYVSEGTIEVASVKKI